MRLLLIRHGETVDNVAGIYAGITDTALTNHGVLQANRLANHLSSTGIKVAHIFSSDLQRAFKTAEAIRESQSPTPPETTKLQLLREQDLGFYEGKKFSERTREGDRTGKDAHLEAHRGDPGFVEVESKESMRIRVETFIDAHLVQLMHEVEDDEFVAVVAHGIILSHLWRAILKRFLPFVTIATDVHASEPRFSLEYIGGWSNTGYLDLEVKQRPDPSSRAAASSAGTGRSAEISTSNQATFSFEPALLDGSASKNKTSPSVSKRSTSLPQQLASTPAASLSPSAVRPSPRGLNKLSLLVRAVNSQEHLKGLKKTRGGIGSLKHDSNQKTVDSFFKKRRLDEQAGKELD